MTMNLLERIEKALSDFTSGRASMHVPPMDTDVDMVLADCQSQLTAITSQLESVVAENAALKKFCKNAAFDADYEAELSMERGGFTDALNDIETPATSAFLDEVRASGVEIARNALIKFVEDEVGPNGNVPGLIRGAEACESIAAQIRQGGAV